MSSATHLSSRARSIFEDLGYSVDPGGRSEFRARRDWKEVRVRAVSGPPEDLPRSGDLWCFVTDDPGGVRRAVRRSDPEYEYAVLAVDGDDYEVVRAPPAGG